MAERLDRRRVVAAGSVAGALAILGYPRHAGTTRAKRRVYATIAIDCAIKPTSAFGELPDDVLRDMIAAMYDVEDQPEMVDDALGWAVGPLKAAFEAGARLNYRFQRHADTRPVPVIFDAMIDAYEPNLIRAQCTASGIANFYAGHRAGLGRALRAAARRGYHYRATGASSAA